MAAAAAGLLIPSELCEAAVYSGLTPLDLNLLTQNTRKETLKQIFATHLDSETNPAERKVIPTYSSLIDKFKHLLKLTDNHIYGRSTPSILNDQLQQFFNAHMKDARPPGLTFSTTLQNLDSVDYCVTKCTTESVKNNEGGDDYTPLINRQFYYTMWDFRFLMNGELKDLSELRIRQLNEFQWSEEERAEYYQSCQSLDITFASANSYGSMILQNVDGYTKTQKYFQCALEVFLGHMRHTKRKNIAPSNACLDIAMKVHALFQPVRVVPKCYPLPVDIKKFLEFIGSRFLSSLAEYMANLKINVMSNEVPKELYLFYNTHLKACSMATIDKFLKLCLKFVPAEAFIIMEALYCVPNINDSQPNYSDLYYPNRCYQELVRQTWLVRQMTKFQGKINLKGYMRVKWHNMDKMSDQLINIPRRTRMFTNMYNMQFRVAPADPAYCQAVIIDESDMSSSDEYEPDETGCFPYEVLTETPLYTIPSSSTDNQSLVSDTSSDSLMQVDLTNDATTSGRRRSSSSSSSSSDTNSSMSSSLKRPRPREREEGEEDEEEDTDLPPPYKTQLFELEEQLEPIDTIELLDFTPVESLVRNYKSNGLMLVNKTTVYHVERMLFDIIPGSIRPIMEKYDTGEFYTDVYNRELRSILAHLKELNFIPLSPINNLIVRKTAEQAFNNINVFCACINDYNGGSGTPFNTVVSVAKYVDISYKTLLSRALDSVQEDVIDCQTYVNQFKADLEKFKQNVNCFLIFIKGLVRSFTAKDSLTRQSMNILRYQVTESRYNNIIISVCFTVHQSNYVSDLSGIQAEST